MEKKEKKKRDKDKIVATCLSMIESFFKENLVIAKEPLKYFKTLKNCILTSNFKVLLHFSTKFFSFFPQIYENSQIKPKLIFTILPFENMDFYNRTHIY